jgi:hypothetical protein
MQQEQNLEGSGEQRYNLASNIVLPITNPISTPLSTSLLARLQQFFIGKTAFANIAGSIESPIRLAPQQSYSLRIRITGRDKPVDELGGLSSLIHGDVVRIATRSALHEQYTHVMREVAVELPEKGTQLEVTIPFIALGITRRWRSERIHVFFLDGVNQPLYEQPFALDLVISPFVAPGKEGYLSIPIPL